MDKIEWKEWLERMVAGDQKAFQHIYELTSKDVFRTVSFLIEDQHDVDDIVNGVYIRMWKSIAKYDPQRPFSFWLHSLVVHEIQDWRRKLWRRFRILEKNKEFWQDQFYKTDEEVLHKETRSELLELVKTLSYKHREVIIMRYFHEYSLEEIGLLVGIPIGTVKSRLHTAHRQLRKEMGKLPVEEGEKINGF
ncbi:MULTISPECIES: sigma-70 family RNA polymerase sigma factor [Bacillus]|uniref:RNA polymerase subunit sigma n=1 Tax=Bacillus cereus TaxID=1396 RepID=A0A2C1LZ28_BACCE|nr:MULTISPECIES: sigma-70 family RNA polymerase sigma factor [Bacillus]MDH4424129.1 sigma-70 family RNA polymerase sigma factor [Bacillus cereus]PER20789.1 RNA polymerase subunit sigma [Bacillus cereus]PFA60078.1 RNA polymerase subunit sigma [Bacillus sp. AFS015896]PGL84572.1 RNA polymerase subunit sigma [Bacillus sp. AFS054943]PGU03220.1 RNA polymerase subunit sigma [Bacillus cereus]